VRGVDLEQDRDIFRQQSAHEKRFSDHPGYEAGSAEHLDEMDYF